jgi:hypothetical protein
MSEQVPVAVPVVTVVVGAAFVLIGLLRPTFLWNLGKIRAGRDWIGDGGMTAALVIFGLVIVGLGVTLFIRR